MKIEASQTNKTPLIFEAIASAMKDIAAIGKNKKNISQNFNFRGIDDIYNSLHPIFAKTKLFTIPEVLDDRQDIRDSRNGGKLTYRILTIRYTCYAADGSSVSGVVIGEAMDSGDKSANKAMAIAHKYFLVQLFTIPTQDIDDPDKDTYQTIPKYIPAIMEKPSFEDCFNKIELAQNLSELEELYKEAYLKISKIKDKDSLNKLIAIKDKRKMFLEPKTIEIGDL